MSEGSFGNSPMRSTINKPNMEEEIKKMRSIRQARLGENIDIEELPEDEDIESNLDSYRENKEIKAAPFIMAIKAAVEADKDKLKSRQP